MKQNQLKDIIEAALLVAGNPLNLDKLRELFIEGEQPGNDELRAALQELALSYQDRLIELKEVGSGFRIQARREAAPWINRLWEEKPQRYSRSLLETLALIAYRQPITRAEIEEVRGVAVSSHIVKTLLDREWVRVVGHRDVPGRPALFGTTKQFLDYFNLKSLDELPPLIELRSIDDINNNLALELSVAFINDGQPSGSEQDNPANRESESQEISPQVHSADNQTH